MNASLRIAIADDEPLMRDYYREALARMGHRVTTAASDGRGLIEGCRADRPDLILTDIKMPGLDGIDAAVEIGGGEPIPIILVSAYHDGELLERAGGGHVFGFLVKPIKQDDLKAAIAIAMRRFEDSRALREEAGELRQALEDRKVIERAKGVLMKKAGLDENEAFKRLRRLARDGNQKLVEVARMVLTAEAAFEPPPLAGP
jgi:AmiR/NasT family two-component response regulator